MPIPDTKPVDLPQEIMAKRAELSRKRDEVMRLADAKEEEFQKYTSEGPAFIRWIKTTFLPRYNTLIGEKFALNDQLNTINDRLNELPENPVESSIESLKAQVAQLEEELSEFPPPPTKQLNPVEADKQWGVERQKMSLANKIIELNKLIAYKQDNLNPPVIAMPVEAANPTPRKTETEDKGFNILLKAKEFLQKFRAATSHVAPENPHQHHEIPMTETKSSESVPDLSQQRSKQKEFKASVKAEMKPEASEEFFEQAKVARLLSFDEVHISRDKSSASFKIPSDGSHDDFMDFCDEHDIDYKCVISTKANSDRVQITVRGEDFDKLVHALDQQMNQSSSVFVPT